MCQVQRERGREAACDPLGFLHPAMDAPPCPWSPVFFFFFNVWLCWVFTAARTFSSGGEWGLLFIAVLGLLTVVASLVTEHRLEAVRLEQLQPGGSAVALHRLESAGSVAVAHRLSCSAACGIFLDQGSKPCPLH